MMRSLFSGVAGLRTHQTKMDVIGNNIANVNTVAYKSQSVTFQDLMYQTTANASGANAETGRGGVNAKQIGLGVTMGAISTSITTSGASQSTGNPFDIQISGDAFFIVSDGNDNYFTRAGAFYVDGAGNLAMTSTGYTVMGWQEDATQPGTILKDTVTPLKIMSPENMESQPEQTTAAYLSGVIDKNSTQLTSDTGLVVNITLYDSLGYSYMLKCNVKPDLSGDPGKYTLTPVKLLDSDGIDTEADLKFGTDNSITLEYDTETGKLISPTAVSELTITKGSSANAKDMDAFTSNVKIDVSETTMYDNKGTSTIKGTSGDKAGNYAGRKMGEMSGVSVQTDGKIYASYTNGTTKLLGQIAVATFANPSGLEKEGENLYSATMNSGEFDGIGSDVTASGGSLTTGVLEMSNVDLSAEFTDMITTQRGFQANSRIITVSDTMLEELINLKR